MHETRDDVWCFLLARRAVARASLHLGITSTSQEALDTLAEILISYLERFSHALAVTVESSRRSTANVLDAIVAVPIVTTPAVQRVHYQQSSSALTSASHVWEGPLEDPLQDPSWKGLAAFLFGANWEQQLLLLLPDGDYNIDDGESPLVDSARASASAAGGRPGVGGKVGPSAMMMVMEDENGISGGGAGLGAASSMMGAGGGGGSGGWCAPYPDELPPFPTLKNKKRRPYNFLETTENDDTMNQQYDEDYDNYGDGDIPDRVFLQEEWGLAVADSSLAAGGGEVGAKRRRNDDKEEEEGDAHQERPLKRVRISEPTGNTTASADGLDAVVASSTAATTTATSSTMDDLFLPKFLPPFPPQRDAARTVVETLSALSSSSAGTGGGGGDGSTGISGMNKTKEGEDAGTLVVRSSLVALHQQQQRETYWGSGWEDHQQSNLAVPWGRPATDGGGSGSSSAFGGVGGGSNGGNTATTAPTAAASAAQIVPLGRASGSRVSRILEGSMDGS